MTAILLAVAAAAGAAVVALVVWFGGAWRPPWRLIGGVFTYLPSFIQLPVHIGMALSAASAPASLTGTERARTSNAAPLLVPLGVAAIIAVVYLFNVRDGDDLRIGAGRVGGLLAVLGLVAVLIRRAESGLASLLIYARLLVPVVWLQSLATALFIAQPGIKDAYLHSGVANVLTGGRSSLLWSSLPDNVLFADKSGGLLFVNANAGSLVMGVWACALFASASVTGSRFERVSGAVALLGSFASGSKTAWILAVALPVTALACRALTSSRYRAEWSVLTLLAAPLVGLAGLLLVSSQTAFLSASEISSSARGALWDGAFRLIALHPIAGVGYGRWFDYWAGIAAAYAQPNYLPPHNFLIYLWVELGVLPALGVLVALLGTFLSLLRFFRRNESLRPATIWLTAGLSWVVLHGMFDATDFYGVVQTLPFFALVLAWPHLPPDPPSAKIDLIAVPVSGKQ